MRESVVDKINFFIQVVLLTLAALLSIFAIYLLVSKLTEHSPDAITIVSWTVSVLLALQIAIISMLFQMKGSLGRLEQFKEQMQDFMKQTINEVSQLKKKFK